MTANFITFEQVAERIAGKTIAIVGSGPGVLDNEPGFVDSHDVVIRINNYKLSKAAGYRADVHYSFYGMSIRKVSAELRVDGVTMCMCKCPNSKPIESEWHERNGKQIGIDFRELYRRRQQFWFCDTYIPDDMHFMQAFWLLKDHIPSTGFAALWDVMQCNPASVYLTGFDFFQSRIHNVDEAWRPGRQDDPIRHRPDLERDQVEHMHGMHDIKFDEQLSAIMLA